MSTEQPRTPAGSPDGGQFASTVGNEGATQLAAPSSHRVGVFALHASDRILELDTQITDLRRQYTAKSVNAAVGVVRQLCPDASEVAWEWCGDGDAPTTLGSPTVTCPHAAPEPGVYSVGPDSADLYDFAAAHGVTDPRELDAIDGLAANLDEQDMMDFCARGTELTISQTTEGEFTVNLAPPPAPVSDDSTMATLLDGTREWRDANRGLHRTDGPAVERPNGDRHWFVHGLPHRADGPASEYHDGTKAWWADGERHRTDGPAIERPDDIDEWWVHGVRQPGPGRSA